MKWKEFADLLRKVRYRVFRLANLCVSEKYLQFHQWRTGQIDALPKLSIGKLNKRLRDFLVEEGEKNESQNRICKNGALPSYIVDALSKYKIGALTSKSKWQGVVRGKTALPTFRGNLAIPIRCDHSPRKAGLRRLERISNGDVELDLMVCLNPYPRVVLKTGKLDGSALAVLNRLLDNPEQSLDGYRQRCFEVCQDRNDPKRWWLHVTYDFPAVETKANKEIVVGIDVGWACPLYVALNNGEARLGYWHFKPLGERAKSLESQHLARRRSMLRGGKDDLAGDTARSGHGRRRRLKATEILAGRINHAYDTLNHQFAKSVVEFAKNHGAGTIQMEDLGGLKDDLQGTLLGQRWRYFQLQEFIKQKAEEAGIEVRKVNPRYTSRRCSKCGYIHVDFDRKYRDTHRENGKTARFKCPKCEFKADPDYNAAKNLANLDIEALIKRQCRKQGIAVRGDEAVT